MRFNFVANGENCLIDVEMQGATGKATVYSGKSAEAKVTEYALGSFRADSSLEEVARVVLAYFDATSHLAPQPRPVKFFTETATFKGVLTPVK